MTLSALYPPSSHVANQPEILSKLMHEEGALDTPALLHDAMEIVSTLREGVQVDESRVKETFGKLAQEFPDLESLNFLQNYKRYTYEEWERAQEWIATKQAEFLQKNTPETVKTHSHRHIHPGYMLIDLGEKFENRQIELILKHDAENRRTIQELNTLNSAQTMMVNLRDKKEVSEAELSETIGALNRAFPTLHFHDFAANYKNYTDQQWDRAYESISNKEKLLLSSMSPRNKEIEELMSDKNKVHEIIAEILKKLNEADQYAVRKTGGQ